MRIALISLDQFWQDKNINKERCKEFVIKASKNNCKLIIFPEMTLTGFSLENKFINDSAEDPRNSETMNFFAALSQNYQVNIIFGMTFRDTKSDLSENSMCISHPGEGSSKLYSKVHPFSYMGEDKVIKSGNKYGSFSLDAINFSTSICYDLRFPIFYNLQNKNCHCYICIANWPQQRVNHWRSLLTARAIENQVFMIGVNRTGVDGNNLEYSKSSYVISPMGDKLEPIKMEKEMDIYEIKKDIVEKYRKEHPFINDSNNNLYFELSKTDNEFN